MLLPKALQDSIARLRLDREAQEKEGPTAGSFGVFDAGAVRDDQLRADEPAEESEGGILPLWGSGDDDYASSSKVTACWTISVVPAARGLQHAVTSSCCGHAHVTAKLLAHVVASVLSCHPCDCRRSFQGSKDCIDARTAALGLRMHIRAMVGNCM